MELNRREFVAAGAAALVASRFAFGAGTQQLPLAFSTLGCPKWELAKILEFAQANGFAAVELRGLMGSLDLPSRPEFVPERIAQTKKEIAGHGIKIACVSSSTELHVADPAKRALGLADGKRFIDLAQALSSPYVRVFGNKFEGGTREEIIARVAAGMHELAEYSGPLGVTVIIESHGDFVDSPTLKEVLTRANSEYVGLLWDAHHTFVDGHEQPEHTVAQLGKWIRHTHLKDSLAEGKERKYVLTGQGDVPVKAQVEALGRMGYKGYYCFEWEKLWHPDLLEPEVAFPDYVRAMTGYLRG
jgi:sugar phosphate isomerase/epimerase